MPDPGGGLRAARRRRLPRRLQPGADRPGQPQLEPAEHPEDRLRGGRGLRGRGRRVLRHRGRPHGAGAGTREAELAKLLENTFRHVNIALVNELAMYCHELGIDVWSVIDMAATKPFGFMRFTPGPGVGGHCLPIDPSYLSWQVRRVTRPDLPVRRDRQRRQRQHARLRRVPGRSSTSTGGAGRSTAAGCCWSGWPTSATPATRASHRRRSSRTGWRTLGAELRAVDPLVAPSDVPAGVQLVECVPRPSMRRTS